MIRAARRGASRRRDRSPHLESLEPRIVLSTWIGGGTDSNWMTGANWSGGIAPVSGASLVFPANVSHQSAVNNFPAGMTFNSIEIDGSGYTLSGNAIDLAHGITTTYSSGTSTDVMNTQLGGTISVGAGGELYMDSALSAAAGLTVSGGGTVDLLSETTYAGLTTIEGAGTTLLVDGKVGPVQVDAGATLGGDGTAGNVNSTGGIIDPGGGRTFALIPSNVLNVGSLTLDDHSTLIIRTGGPSVSSYGEVVASGAVILGGTLDAGAPGPTIPGVLLTIIDNTSGLGITGTFAGLPEGSTVALPGQVSRITYRGGSGADVVLTDLADFTSTTISATTPVSSYGQPVTFTAVVSGGLVLGPSGTVAFFADGTPIATVPLGADGLAGSASASFSTSSLGPGSHVITAAFSGESGFASSQSGPTQETVDAARTQDTLIIDSVRNKRGEIVKLVLKVNILPVSPGGSVPTGSVTYFRKGHPISTVALSNGRAALTLKRNQALKKSFTVEYSGDAHFDASMSSPVVPTRKSLTMSARLQSAFVQGGKVAGRGDVILVPQVPVMVR